MCWCWSFAVKLEAWERCVAAHSSVPRSCRDVAARWRHDPALSLITLHDLLTSAVNELLSIGDSMSENRACMQSVPSTLLSGFGELREADTLFARTNVLRAGHENAVWYRVARTHVEREAGSEL
ncbi:hypothetical protein ERJ75_000446000 [Trypanosoma vivax]|nr:hypothetical protein ERJ75_000446000 [Trypanosoma vivax]